MDRNVFVAIALSMSVLLLGCIFETPKKTSEQQTNQKVEQKMSKALSHQQLTSHK